MKNRSAYLTALSLTIGDHVQAFELTLYGMARPADDDGDYGQGFSAAIEGKFEMSMVAWPGGPGGLHG